MHFLGIDLGSSSIKLSVLDAETGKTVAGVSVPDFEMEMAAPQFGWAEQDPSQWWEYVQTGIKTLGRNTDLKKIAAIGIAYQMHGLVLTDENLNPVRPSIIWCDSRAADIGNTIYDSLGHKASQGMILGSPGNFTASKLKWVKDNEPEVFAKAKYMMLPGDFIAAKLSGIAQTSTSGLSEAALWNFAEARLAVEVLEAMELPLSLIPEIVPNFGHQSAINPDVAASLGFNNDVKITYRAGDQPNNALSLNVLKPGEIATTAGTSAVIYAVTEKDAYDASNRVNTFLHVNNSDTAKRNGVLLCINGSGILYQWLRKVTSLGNTTGNLISYDTLNTEAAKAVPGAKGLRFYPFGNGVERIFNNKQASSGIQNLNFNIHHSPELVRAACEGIVFAMNYGFDIMKEIGAGGSVVRAGKANLFLSPVFREIFANTTQTTVELYNTAGADGAARGAAFGFGFYKSIDEAFSSLECLERIEPAAALSNQYSEIYQQWKQHINIEDIKHEYN
ncbi:carbohydrate kinase [Flavobacterium rivuli WB 3.3-2 = DSM 21788]|uniref:Carbohydrate kinase n=1 Tax=Flavobacterium rivuli WB 3.3-2 = DSM 21788 TaxID=1121895 RepID=A0A0A2M6M1_9FLAO|nr:FGGY family carbohydrate kinase [Flavobacterium rivuli]KGO87939.1 carbohydrate kinase [Flavobacterium rivuli WB 3.3-2 = DSM 21788]